MTTSRTRNWLRLSGATIAVAVLSLAAAFAQTAGARLEGIVKDASQAVIPGVAVTVTNEGTNISTTSTTNETGFYVFVNLPPGTYTLASELQGFKRYVNKGIVLQVGATITINITLQTGELTAEVVVSAAAPLIDVTSGKVGSVVQERQVVDLPLNGRNPMMLFYLQAGTNPRDAIGGSQQAVGSVDGLRTNASNIKIEGVWASDVAFDMSPAAPNATVPLEAVGEYRVTTSSASAEAGRGAGAQVQVVYRSGTNSFHGSAYEFNRNTVYNANNFFANKQGTDRPKFLRNQYGASLGGPIIKNKTFFFGTWEGQREIAGSILNRYSYTQTTRNGIFRYYKKGQNSNSLVDKAGNPTVPDGDIGTINLFTVDPSRQGLDSSGKVAYLFKLQPLPNNYDLGDGFNLGGYRYISNEPNNYNQFVAKVDHTLSRTNQLSVSLGGYSRDNYNGLLYTGSFNQLYTEEKRNIMIGLVSALRANLTNEFRAGATRRLTDQQPQSPLSYDTKGVFILTGITNTGGRGGAPEGNPVGPYLPQTNPVSAFSLSDNVAWVKKNHTFKVGFEVAYYTHNFIFGGDEYMPTVYSNNTYNPANVPSMAGLASADRSRAQQFVNDLTGTIGNINQTYNANRPDAFLPYEPSRRYFRDREWGTFFQDTWKMASNLTFNYGVRWDLVPPAWAKDGMYSYPQGGSLSVLGISGPVGVYRSGLAPDQGKGIIHWDWNNFGPNVGFTWDPFKDGKTSVSANYRVAYDRNMTAVYILIDYSNVGLVSSLTATPFTRFSDPNLYQTVGGKAPVIPLPVGKPFAPLPFERQGRAYAADENTRTPYTQNWSLRIQREIGKNWYIQGAYVGNISVGGWRAMNYNQVEIRANGFLDGFLAAQRNLAANGNPNKGESIGVLGKLFAPLGGIPTSQNNNITQGQTAALADFIDTTTQGGSKRGWLVTAAGFPDTFFRKNPQMLNANIIDNMSVSTWNGFKAELGKRMSAGIYVQFQYTLGKGLTDYTGGQGLFQDFRDNANRKLDKSLQQYDSTHIIQTNGIWELPFGPNKRWLSGMAGWQNAILGGWQLNGIFQLATSRPFTVTSNRFNLAQGRASTVYFAGSDFNLMANVIRGSNQITTLTDDQKKLFTNPGTADPGGVPYFAFRGPIYANVDTSMFKNFRLPFLGEQGNLQFRMEAFNVLNRVNFDPPPGANLNINAGTFGVINSAGSPRILQFALKINF